MKKMTRSLVLMAMLAAGAAQAQAQMDPQAFARCRAMPDAGARLGCYDAIPLAPAGTAGPKAAAPGTGAAVGGVVPAQTGAPADFGLENRRPATVDAIESAIPGAFGGWEPGTRWQLANGQVWQVSDRSRASYSLRDPKVKVRRGIVGNYVMEIEGVAQLVRVRRIE